MPFYKGVLDELIRQGHASEAREVAGRLLSLRHRLQKQIPQRNAQSSVLIATWNIREFGADAKFGTRLVVVLGHTSCGAIQATVDELGRRTEEQSRNLRSIVDRIRPSVEPLLGTSLAHDREVLIHQAVRANIRMSAHQLRHGSELLEQLIQTDGLRVVGAEYSLDTGVVEFFDGAEL